MFAVAMDHASQKADDEIPAAIVLRAVSEGSRLVKSITKRLGLGLETPYASELLPMWHELRGDETGLGLAESSATKNESELDPAYDADEVLNQA